MKQPDLIRLKDFWKYESKIILRIQMLHVELDASDARYEWDTVGNVEMQVGFEVVIF